MSEQRVVKIEEIVFDLAEDYIISRKNELEEFSSQVESKRYEDIQKNFHKICGSSGSYGFMDISNAAGKIEDDIKEEKFETLEENFKVYKDLVATTVIEIKKN